jgi:hypothetical protein
VFTPLTVGFVFRESVHEWAVYFLKSEILGVPKQLYQKVIRSTYISKTYLFSVRSMKNPSQTYIK